MVRTFPSGRTTVILAEPRCKRLHAGGRSTGGGRRDGDPGSSNPVNRDRRGRVASPLGGADDRRVPDPPRRAGRPRPPALPGCGVAVLMAASFAPPHPRRRPAPGEALAGCPVGIVPITWNNADLPELAPPVPAADVLEEIRRLGYQGTQLGTGFLTGEALALELRKRDLRLTEVYAGVPIGADGPLPHAAAVVRGRLNLLHEAQGEVLIVALERTPDRDGCVGRALGAPALTPAGWQALGALLDTIAREAHELGHPVAFHNHGATYVETPDEIDRLLKVTDSR